MTMNVLRKRLRGTCTKTAFVYNNKCYCLLLANIIVSEFEEKVIRRLITNGTIKFYTRFVDDTLLPDEYEKFDRNLKFTFDRFEN